MSNRRIREQHRKKFQELINPKNRSKRFRSDTPSSRGGNNIPSSSRDEGNNNALISSGGEGNKNTPAAEAKTTPTAKATLFSAELEAKAILS